MLPALAFQLIGNRQAIKGLQIFIHIPLKLLARPAGFEPAAYGFEEQESHNKKMNDFNKLILFNYFLYFWFRFEVLGNL